MANLLDWQQKDPDRRKKDLEVSSYGIKQIKRMISEHGIDCDFRESGMLEVAMNEKQIKTLCNRIFLSREDIYEYTPA
jgi:hypothetical protein